MFFCYFAMCNTFCNKDYVVKIEKHTRTSNTCVVAIVIIKLLQWIYKYNEVNIVGKNKDYDCFAKCSYALLLRILRDQITHIVFKAGNFISLILAKYGKVTEHLIPLLWRFLAIGCKLVNITPRYLDCCRIVGNGHGKQTNHLNNTWIQILGYYVKYLRNMFHVLIPKIRWEVMQCVRTVCCGYFYLPRSVPSKSTWITTKNLPIMSWFTSGGGGLSLLNGCYQSFAVY